jgi:hypothetical protein
LELPFTLAHPAAVLPLRKRLVFSALVIGAMSPDFHYFLGLHIDAKTSHSLAGAFYFCLPVGLATLWLFHRILKPALISLVPEWHQARLARFAKPFSFGPGKRFGMILLSLLVGIFSHLLWDSFTHNHGWVVRQFPVLRTVVWPQVAGGRPGYALLQHASSLAGMAILAIAYRRWARATSPQAVPADLRLSPRLKLAVVAGIGAEAFVIGGLYAFVRYGDAERMSILVSHAAISFVTLTFLGLLAFSLWLHRRSRSVAAGEPLAELTMRGET